MTMLLSREGKTRHFTLARFTCMYFKYCNNGYTVPSETTLFKV